MSLLPDRPRGVRKHWRRVAPDLAECGARLRDYVRELLDDCGDPVEAVEFYRRSELKRIEAVFADGRRVSLSRHAAGHFTYRIRTAHFEALPQVDRRRHGGSTVADSDGDDGA